MEAPKDIYIGADHDVTYEGAAPRTAPTSYLNSGTCTWRLLDSAGTLVTGATGTLSYTAASNGNYIGEIDAAYTALLTAGETYYVEVTFVQSGYKDVRRLPRTARYRGAA